MIECHIFSLFGSFQSQLHALLRKSREYETIIYILQLELKPKVQ